MEGELQLDLDTYRAMVRAALGRRLWLLRVLGLLIVVLAVLTVAVGRDVAWGVAYLVLGTVLLGYDELAARLGWRRLRALTGRAWRYRVSDAGVSVQTPATDVELRWEAITHVVRTPRMWVLRTTTRQRVPVPRAAFSPHDIARIDQRLETRHPAS